MLCLFFRFAEWAGRLLAPVPLPPGRSVLQISLFRVRNASLYHINLLFTLSCYLKHNIFFQGFLRVGANYISSIRWKVFGNLSPPACVSDGGPSKDVMRIRVSQPSILHVANMVSLSITMLIAYQSLTPRIIRRCNDSSVKRNHCGIYRVAWSIASLAAVPYMLFTTINYLDFPFGSGNNINESAFCALLEHNIWKVST